MTDAHPSTQPKPSKRELLAMIETLQRQVSELYGLLFTTAGQQASQLEIWNSWLIATQARDEALTNTFLGLYQRLSALEVKPVDPELQVLLDKEDWLQAKAHHPSNPDFDPIHMEDSYNGDEQSDAIHGIPSANEEGRARILAEHPSLRMPGLAIVRDDLIRACEPDEWPAGSDPDNLACRCEGRPNNPSWTYACPIHGGEAHGDLYRGDGFTDPLS